jgi:hypothetical protein
MATTLLVCPKCSARLPANLTGGRPRCPHCGVEAVTKQVKGDVQVSRPYAPPPAPPTAPAERPPVEAAAPSGPSHRALLLVLGGTAALLLLGTGLVVALALAPGGGKKDTAAQANAPATARTGDEERRPLPEESTPVRVEPVTETHPAKPEPAETPPPPTTLTEAEQKEVDEAIKRGVAFLKQNAPGGPMGDHPLAGLHPLVGLTLLECGVPTDVPALANLIKYVRQDAPNLTRTYNIALAILFLDRLGDKQDEELIRRLAARLIAGQNEAGGWSYECPALSEPDGLALLTYLDTNPLPALAGGPNLPLVVRPESPPARKEAPLSRDKLPNAVKNRAVVTYDPARKIPQGAGDDNSNTQFAVLGVWAARRHGVAAERCVALISARFHQTQNDDGSWGYNIHSTLRRDSMTCAGLLGLAVGKAGDASRQSAEKDPAIAKGLEFLGKKVQSPGGVKKRGKGNRNLFIGADSLGDLYWLWSVERVGVIYNLATIGGKDWYAWGAGLLVAHQQDDGSWVAGQGQVVDTCFALLFLKRVNVAKDLTHQLQMLGPIRDPGLSRKDKN